MEKFYCAVDEIKEQAWRIEERFFDEVREGELVIFGSGACGHRIYNLLCSYGRDIVCFCDNGMAGTIDKATGRNILRPEELKDAVSNPAILVCVGSEGAGESICRQLLSLGFEKSQIHIMNEYFYWQTRKYLASNIEKYKQAYQLLDDAFSKTVYLEKMRKDFLLSSISEIVSPDKEEYFDEKIILTDDEMFIDCGGFDGDTALHFIGQCDGHYRGIVIFEPEQCKKEVIAKRMGDYPYELYQVGVWSKSAKLRFDARGTSSSHITEWGGGCVIETIALDETVYDKRPTYIKMDIEGAEQEALKGCRKIIQDYKPKLAICIYHKSDDLFEIPIMIKEMNPEYKLYVRQYADAWYDTVLYAV